MGDFEDALNAILSSPKDMEKIMGLARELSGDTGSGARESSPPEPDIPGLGDISPKLLGALGKILCELRSGDDGKAALLASMKPYLRPERREELERALKIARVARAARLAVSELGGDLDFGL